MKTFTGFPSSDTAVKSGSFDIRIARTPAERAAVYAFRYRVYVEEMRRTQKWADHDKRTIEEPLDQHARLITAFLGTDVVGTCRINFGHTMDPQVADFWHLRAMEQIFPQGVCLATKLMIDRDMRRTPLFNTLAQMVFREALYGGAGVLVLDCNAPLRELFRKLGFIAYRTSVHPEYGQVTLLALFVQDASHLKNIGSPFYAVLQEYNQFRKDFENERNGHHQGTLAREVHNN